MCFSAVVKAANGAFSSAHIQHLKNCSAYTEVYRTQIPTDDPNSPYLNLESTETIKGWLNGKCITQSTVRSLDLRGQEIFIAKCALSKDQMASIIDKMTKVNTHDDDEIRKNLQDELLNYIKDNKVCNTKSYLEE